MSVGPPPPIHHPPPASTWTEPPWSGWIETTGDALLILEAARQGRIPRVTRRLVDAERKMITSGSVFVFDEEESGIKRWTDGFFWSPSRILGNFLLYRETDKRGAGHRSARAEQELNESEAAAAGSSSFSDGQTLSRAKTDSVGMGVDKQRERILVGSLTNSYKFKPDGLMKKTFSVTIGGVAQHLISYYKVADVEAGRLRPPSSLPELASLDISPEYLDKTHFRNPPKVEIGVDGVPRYRGEADDVDGSAPSPPLSASVPLLSEGRVLAMDHGAGAAAAGKRATARYEPYSSSQPAPKRPRRDTLSDTGLTAISTNTPSSSDSTSSNTPTPTRDQSMSVSPQLSSVGTATPQQTPAVPAPAVPVYGMPAGTPTTHPGYAPPQPPYGVPMQYYPGTYPQWAPPASSASAALTPAVSTTPAPAGVGGGGPGGTGSPAPHPHAPTVHGSYPSQIQAPSGSAPAPPGPMPSGGMAQYPQQHQQQAAGYYPYYPPPPPGNYSHPRMGQPPPPSYVHPQMQMHHAPPPPPHMQVPVQMHGVSMGMPGVHGIPPHAQMYPLPPAHAHAPAYSWPMYPSYAPQPVGVPGPYAYAAPGGQQQQQQGAVGGSGAGGGSGGGSGGGAGGGAGGEAGGGGGAEAQVGGSGGGTGQKAADAGATE